MNLSGTNAGRRQQPKKLIAVVGENENEHASAGAHGKHDDEGCDDEDGDRQMQTMDESDDDYEDEKRQEREGTVLRAIEAQLECGTNKRIQLSSVCGSHISHYFVCQIETKEEKLARFRQMGAGLSALLAKTKAFLPNLKKANEDLEQVACEHLLSIRFRHLVFLLRRLASTCIRQTVSPFSLLILSGDSNRRCSSRQVRHRDNFGAHRSGSVCVALLRCLS
jgi:hypothetical protein